VQIKVQYYGVARVMLGILEETLEVKAPITLLELIRLIADRYDGSLGTYLIDPATSSVRAHPALTYLVDGHMVLYHEVGTILLEDGSTVSIIPTQAG
jgi:molybdopterin converting factor small subunit